MRKLVSAHDLRDYEHLAEHYKEGVDFAVHVTTRECSGVAVLAPHGGRIEGRNIELIPNRRIVQAWRPASWPAGVYSLVRFELAARGAGSRLVLDHAGFTEDKWEGLNSGWPKMYWEPLQKYLNA